MSELEANYTTYTPPSPAEPISPADVAAVRAAVDQAGDVLVDAFRALTLTVAC
eukprot:m.102793 g.102793  ORF g.102793 m.102793 type:complete len:53 (+) comp8835_c0_seq4:834-992(+)